MKTNKHIAMWACPRSRSTVITRAFENLDGCIVYDEPLEAPNVLMTTYTMSNSRTLAEQDLKQLILQNNVETDLKKVIEKLTGNLPDGKLFSFQKMITGDYRSEFGIDWAKKLTNFFLIRHPQDIIFSFDIAERRTGITEPFTQQNLGMKTLYEVFQQIEVITGQTPLVIHSDDLIKNPPSALKWLCKNLGLAFDEKMLTWKANLEDSNLKYTKLYANSASGSSEPWFETLRSTQTFLPYEKKEKKLPDRLIPLLDESIPYYEKLLQHCHIFEWSEHRV
ncbi:sulfotransferase-like domain-containing protein [Limnofasciculus baicalensis]|uniref:Sulfotransferase family protein n=1 Tax=Limnofasciculus baicalensis BBK-W-15 TaxID=2699891 RepID=A0AAE3GPG6_9CYAN|nr:hypothetical protein [Limnofasciculus baicalensis]MCP2728270.1 hypothetical protein [Limnofasciculus baicalensis BBK-W-15]